MKKIWLKESNSFRCAWRGIVLFVQGELHARVHLVLLLLALLLAGFLQCSLIEFCILIGASALVVCAEAINSAIERLCDVVEPELDERIRVVKDMAAGAVLVAALAALAIGIVILFPKLLARLDGL